MSKEILLVVDSVSHEKGVSKDVIFEAIESAMAMATKKKYGEEEGKQGESGDELAKHSGSPSVWNKDGKRVSVEPAGILPVWCAKVA